MAGSSQPLRALVLNRPDGRTHWLDALERKVHAVGRGAAYTAEPVRRNCRSHSCAAAAIAEGRVRRAGGVGTASQLDTLLQCLSGELATWAKRQPLLVPHAAIIAHAQAAGFSQWWFTRAGAIWSNGYNISRTATAGRRRSLPTRMPTTRNPQRKPQP